MLEGGGAVGFSNSLLDLQSKVCQNLDDFGVFGLFFFEMTSCVTFLLPGQLVGVASEGARPALLSSFQLYVKLWRTNVK